MSETSENRHAWQRYRCTLGSHPCTAHHWSEPHVQVRVEVCCIALALLSHLMHQVWSKHPHPDTFSEVRLLGEPYDCRLAYSTANASTSASWHTQPRVDFRYSSYRVNGLHLPNRRQRIGAADSLLRTTTRSLLRTEGPCCRLANKPQSPMSRINSRALDEAPTLPFASRCGQR